jgi:hypothetical protein
LDIHTQERIVAGDVLTVPVGLARGLPPHSTPKGRMPDTQIDFSASATLRKWPSINKERVITPGARPYMVIEGTLDECIQAFMEKAESQRHLYEIHTEPRSDLVSAIFSAEHIVELARLKDFL